MDCIEQTDNLKYGKYGKYWLVSTFLSKSKKEFISKLRKSMKRLTEEECKPGEITAWEDCYDVLQRVLPKLPESYRALWIIFEYVLPKKKPGTKKYCEGRYCRPDVILLSSDRVLVMEFKQSKGINPDAFARHVHQAGMYKRKLDKYHDASRHMTVLSILVLSKAENRREEQEDCIVCSPDQLADEITHFMGNDPKPYINEIRWLQSTHSVVNEEN